MEGGQIPIVRTSADFEALIAARYIGLANVNLNSDVVERMLVRNTINRKIKRQSVTAYASSFKNYGYCSIGMMCVADDGTLLDGQHRLLALEYCYNTGCNITAWQYVQFGLPKERMGDIDNGVARSYRDSLHMIGVVSNSHYASALRFYACITCPTFRVKFTAAELADVYNNDFKQVFDIGTFLKIAGTNIETKSNYAPAPWVIGAFRLCQKKYGTEAMREPYDQLYTGTDLRQPMVWFRNYIVTHRGEKKVAARTSHTVKTLGVLFGAVQKCLSNEMCNSYVRPTRLGLTVNGIDF